MRLLFIKKLYATAVATTNIASSVIIPQSAKLVQVVWNLRITSAAATSDNLYQLSIQSTGQFAINDPNGILDEFVVAPSNAATEVEGISECHLIPGGFQFNAGQTIYLHNQSANNLSGAGCNCLLYFATGNGG